MEMPMRRRVGEPLCGALMRDRRLRCSPSSSPCFVFVRAAADGPVPGKRWRRLGLLRSGIREGCAHRRISMMMYCMRVVVIRWFIGISSRRVLWVGRCCGCVGTEVCLLRTRKRGLFLLFAVAAEFWRCCTCCGVQVAFGDRRKAKSV